MPKTKTLTCYVSECQEPTHTIGGTCEKHNQEFRARWKEEHTRKPGDTRKGWLIGDECRVVLRGVAYDATIIDMSDISRADKHNYDLFKLELTKTWKAAGWDGREIIQTKTWIHPEPVQSYKLKKRLLEED